MLKNNCLDFMILIASLIDFPLLRRECVTTKSQLAKFDKASLVFPGFIGVQRETEAVYVIRLLIENRGAN
jgi:hypothetical protein